MNAPIDTLAFAEKFEGAGFGHDQARILAMAFGEAHDAGRDELVTKAFLTAELSQLKVEIADLKVELVKEISAIGKDVSNRLWSTVAIIAGVSTAISATIGAGVALILKSGGLS